MNKLLNSVIIFLISFPISAFAEKDSLKPVTVEAFSMMGALNMAMGLVVVIALILGLAWVLKKYGRLPNNNQADMKVLGGLSLGAREKAILIEVENTRLLVGVTPGHIQTLHILDAISEKNNVDLASSTFEAKLESVIESQK